MQPSVAGLLRVGDAPELAAAGQFAGVADLAAHLGVAGAGVEDDGGLVLERNDFQNFGLDRQFLVADEFRGRGGFDLRKRNDFLLLRGAGAGALLFHQLFKTFLVHGQTAFARHQLGEVERKTVGVVKLETQIRQTDGIDCLPSLD